MTNRPDRAAQPEGETGQQHPASGVPRIYVLASVVAAIVGFVAFYVVLGPSGNPDAQSQAPAAVKTAAPSGTGGGLKNLARGHVAAFLVKAEPAPLPEIAFKDAEGRDRSLADTRGKVVLLNLWATWCAPCRREMPALDRLQADLGGADFEVVALAIERANVSKPLGFLKEIGVSHLTFGHDETGRLGNTLGAIGMPTTLLLDRQGRELGRLVGPAEWDHDDAKALIRAAIESGAS